MHFDDAFIWYGTEASARAYVEMEARASREGITALASYEQDDRRFGDYDQFVQVHGDTAVVSISGGLGYKENEFTKFFGMMTYESLANIMAALVADDGVKRAVLDVDSPGGMARGVSLASDAIHAARNAGLPVIAHTTGDMMSAAYWVASAAEKVYASKHADVGSIGVIMVHHEISRALDKDGVTVTVFRKGEEKALGSPYEPLDDKAKASIENRLERAYTNFIDTVSANREMTPAFVRNSVASGKVFSATEAHALGLIDGIQTFNHLMNTITPRDTLSQIGATDMSKTPIFVAEPPAGLVALSSADTAPLADAIASILATGDEEQDNDTDEGDEGDAAASAVVVDPTPPAPAAPAFAEMLSSLNTQLVDTRVALDKVTSERGALAAGNSGLRDIVTEYTQTLRIRLGQPAGADLGTLSDGVLVSTHQAIKAQFVARFKPGPQSSVPQQDSALPRSSAAVTRLDQAVRKATSFGK